MLRIFGKGARFPAPRFLLLFRMSKNGDEIYYAVGRGREIGIYNSWTECKAQVDGIANAKYRKFFSLPEAEEFVRFWKDYSSPSKIEKDENPVSNLSKHGANRRRRSDSGLAKSKSKKIEPLGVEKNPEKREVVNLQPYISPIPLPLQAQFRSNVDKFQNFKKPERKSFPERAGNSLPSRSCSQNADAFKRTEPGNSNNFSSCYSTNVGNSSQSARVSSGVVVKTEVAEENEELPDLCSKLPECLGILDEAIKVIKRENDVESKKIKNILQDFLNKLGQTNCSINPQMEVEEKDSAERPEARAEEPAASQQQTDYLSPRNNTPTSPSHRSQDQKSAEVLALNLRLDSFEKRFDSCLKEVGAIVSEMSHLRAEIKELKESLGQGSSSPRKGKDGMLQTTLSFSSQSKPDYSSRAYSTSQGVTSKEDDSNEYKTNRGKRRKLSRSDSSGSTKRFVEDKEDDILSRIKTEEVEFTSFCLDENDFVEVYTDGACHYNGERAAKAGIGIWFGDSHPLNVSEPVIGSATNNVAEIQAARIAIELAIKAGVKKLKILTDSEFLINCVTKWMHRWKRNGWTLVRGGAVKNRKELEKLDKAASKISVRWEKVLAHSGIKGNEMADRLANQGAEKYVS